MKHGKKYQDSAKLVDALRQYDTREGLDLLMQTAKAKFDETVEVHVRLGAPIYPETGRNENNSVNSERVRYYTHAIQTVMSALAAPPEKSAL